MFWNRTTDAPLRLWQLDAAHGVEQGEAPLFNLGLSDQALDGTLGLGALEEFAHQQNTIIPAQVLMGGASALWLWGFLRLSNVRQPGLAAPDAAREPGAVVPVRIIYSGVDTITHMSSLGVMSAPCWLPRAPAADRRIGLSRTTRWMFAPLTEPAAVAPWSTLPFVVQPASEVQSCYLSGEPALAAETRQPHGLDVESDATQSEWLAWLMMAFVAGVLLIALLG